MGGKYFIVSYTVSQNGYRVDTTALINTKANSFAFINTACAINTAKFLNIKATCLYQPNNTSELYPGARNTYSIVCSFG